MSHARTYRQYVLQKGGPADELSRKELKGRPHQRSWAAEPDWDLSAWCCSCAHLQRAIDQQKTEWRRWSGGPRACIWHGCSNRHGEQVGLDSSNWLCMFCACQVRCCNQQKILFHMKKNITLKSNLYYIKHGHPSPSHFIRNKVTLRTSGAVEVRTLAIGLFKIKFIHVIYRNQSNIYRDIFLIETERLALLLTLCYLGF